MVVQISLLVLYTAHAHTDMHNHATLLKSCGYLFQEDAEPNGFRVHGLLIVILL